MSAKFESEFDFQASPPPSAPIPKVLEDEARTVVMEAAQGREVKFIKLYKPEGSSLGFSVVGLKSAHKGELGIYVQEIQPQGIAGKDGRLLEGDQVRQVSSHLLLNCKMTHWGITPLI